jgi:uncharacterized protein YrrD
MRKVADKLKGCGLLREDVLDTIADVQFEPQRNRVATGYVNQHRIYAKHQTRTSHSN